MVLKMNSGVKISLPGMEYAKLWVCNNVFRATVQHQDIVEEQTPQRTTTEKKLNT